MIRDDVRILLQPIVEDLGYTLWGCEYLAQGKHSILRIFIDHDNGIGIDDCEKVSKQISSVLDVEDPITGHYQLEVSSPGIPRPLFYQWQYEKFIGEAVELKLYQPIENSRKITGVMTNTTEEKVIISYQNNELEIPFTNIVKAFLTNN